MSLQGNTFVDAAACGDLAGVRALLASETISATDINRCDKDGRSAFHYACLNDDVPLLTVLLADSRVDVLLRSPKGDTGLHMASLYAALGAMQLLRSDGRVSVDLQNNYGETPLHLCAGSGDKGASKAAALLLGWNASLTIVDKWGRGPLDVSRDNGENSLMAVFNSHLSTLDSNSETAKTVSQITLTYKEKLESQRVGK
jgi:ankyrin repeat protein